MQMRPRLLVTLLAGLVLPALAAAQEADAGAPGTDGGQAAVERERDECVDPLDDQGPLADALRALRLEAGEKLAPITDARLLGLTTLDEGALWSLVGKPAKLERPLTIDEAALLVARLEETGLFSSVVPALQLGGEGQTTLAVTVKEHPTVRKVVVRGLTEVSTTDLLSRLLEAPPERRDHVSFSIGQGPNLVFGDVELHGDHLRIRKKHHRHRPCTWPAPPHAWLALAAGETVHPGVAWRGLRAGAERALDYMRERGYLLARLDAVIDAEGTLTVDADEGKLTAVRIHGVNPRLEGKVLELLDVRTGRPFLASELEAAFERVHDALPFLSSASGNELHAPEARIEVTTEPAGQRLHTVLQARSRHPRNHRPDDDEDDDSSEANDDENDADIDLGKAAHGVKPVGGAELQDTTLDLFFHAEPFNSATAWAELIRHTQVTGFAPGLGGTVGHWDDGGLYLLRVDGQFNVNTKRPSRAGTGDVLERLNAQERIDWLVGPKVALPGLKLAEVGAQFHSLTDTSDRWRITPLDSYLSSVWNNRPNAEYYRRTGVVAFATAHVLERLTVGAEYRLDRYDTVTPLTHVWTIFNSQEPAAPNPSIDDGEWGSVLVRAEFSTRKAGIEKVGDRYRDPERTIVNRGAFQETGLDTVNTLEVADPALGGCTCGVAYTKLVSDTEFYLATGGWSGLRLRFRAAGGNGLPEQKREALGGWDTLRGYGFKEFKGDRSMLGSAEYRLGILGAFVDLGTVRHADLGWDTPHLGTGLELALGDSFHFEAAWRTDSQATAAPELRMLFERVF